MFWGLIYYRKGKDKFYPVFWWYQLFIGYKVINYFTYSGFFKIKGPILTFYFLLVHGIKELRTGSFIMFDQTFATSVHDWRQILILIIFSLFNAHFSSDIALLSLVFYDDILILIRDIFILIDEYWTHNPLVNLLINIILYYFILLLLGFAFL